MDAIIVSEQLYQEYLKRWLPPPREEAVTVLRFAPKLIRMIPVYSKRIVIDLGGDKARSFGAVRRGEEVLLWRGE